MFILSFKTIILATKSINRGLTNSMGWNLGIKNRSIHLFDPFISTPIIETKKRNKIEIENIGSINFIILFFSWTEMIINKNRAIKTKVRCLLKKKYVSLFIFSEITEEVEENEKSNPKKKRNINKNNICLSTFLHHLAIAPVFSLLKLNDKNHITYSSNSVNQIFSPNFIYFLQKILI